jgi:hypothetical protein
MSDPERQADQLVEGWLDAVARAASDLPADQRVELLADLREHIAVARADLVPETDNGVRTLLERLGDPATIAAEARQSGQATPPPVPPPAVPPPAVPPAPSAPPGRSRWGPAWIIAAILTVLVLCGAGCVAAGLAMFTTRTGSGDSPAEPTPVMRPEPPASTASPTTPPSP